MTTKQKALDLEVFEWLLDLSRRAEAVLASHLLDLHATPGWLERGGRDKAIENFLTFIMAAQFIQRTGRLTDDECTDYVELAQTVADAVYVEQIAGHDLEELKRNGRARWKAMVEAHERKRM